jgi:hypothetical protein
MTILTRARGAIIALGLSTMLGLPAFAQQAIEVTEDEVAAVMKEEGFKADISYDDDTGAPVVSSFSNEVKANFEARFDACDEDGFDCEVLRLRAGFYFDKAKEATATSDKLNDWNTNNWGKAYLDGDTMWVQFELNTIGGMTREGLADTVHWFEHVMIDYTKHIGWQAH